MMKEDLPNSIIANMQHTSAIRAKLLDEFAKIYLIHLPEDTTVDDIELVETVVPYESRRWRYELKQERLIVRVEDDENSN